MEIETKTGLLLFVLEHFGEIKGRTRIQKMLYLVNQTGWNAIKDYHFYQYGPYSNWLKRELDILVQRGLVNEEQEATPDEKTLYKYKITKDGSKYLKTINLPPDLVKRTKGFLDELKNYRTDDLEIMTSLYFLRKSEPELDTDERLVKFVMLYKPWYKLPEIGKNLRVFKLMEDFAKN
jgi:hypothetical protein